MNASNVSSSSSVPIGCPPPRQVIPLDRLRDLSLDSEVTCTGMNGDAVGTVGTHISFSNAHAGKNDFGDSPETYVFAHSEKVLEKRVPTVPSPPDLAPMVCALPYDHPRFREPGKGEVVVGLYREDDGTAAPVLLWADTRADLFWDLSLRSYVRPPAWYLRLACQPPIDSATGYPIIEGAVCPF